MMSILPTNLAIFHIANAIVKIPLRCQLDRKSKNMAGTKVTKLCIGEKGDFCTDSTEQTWNIFTADFQKKN